MPDKDMPSWLRESRNTMKQTGKALLAWDEWGKNPARAAGGVTFNVLTTVFTGGEGAAVAGAGKAGAVAKAISVAGKVERCSRCRRRWRTQRSWSARHVTFKQ
ncbi:hypothetical protein ABT072_25480 [Streptomyces sp. NPDC002589]|uniref:hypothetical protein n=1 Tax=Streptomyces sp. NPDC002589 TaxID=3154420 RepID=UPI0033242848